MRAPLRPCLGRLRSPLACTLLREVCSLISVVALLGYGLSVPPPAAAGGPIVVGGTFGVSGVPFTWEISLGPIRYTTDTGTLGSLTNAQANTLVQQMFQVWQDVPTSAISYMREGPIQGVPGGHVATVADFNLVDCPSSGPGAGQNAIVYDADGSLFQALGFPRNVIGFAGPGRINSAGRITCGTAALNGASLTQGPNPLTLDEFSAAFIHEFGHFSGLDHSQINTNCQTNPSSCGPASDDVFGLPTMYPILLRGLTEGVGGPPAQKTLAADDVAWISRLYPVTAPAPPGKTLTSSVYGIVSGAVFFTDGITQAQGVNVIARLASNPRRVAVSVVSGYLYTANRGQPVTGNNSSGSLFGSRNPQLSGTFDIPVPASPPTDYTLEVESIRPSFTGGSSVGPLRRPIPMPGNTPPGPIGSPITATAGATITVPGGIVLVNTAPRFDAFESAQLRLPDPAPLWLRKESLLSDQEAA